MEGAGEAPEVGGAACMADLYVEEVSAAGAEPHVDLVWIGFDDWFKTKSCELFEGKAIICS